MGWGGYPHQPVLATPGRIILRARGCLVSFRRIGDKKFSSANPELPTNAADETTVAVSRGHADVAVDAARKNCRSISPTF